MRQRGVMEIISFEILEEFSEEQIVHGLSLLEDFQRKHDEYRGMNIAKEGSKITLMLGFDSFEDEKRISAGMMKSESTNDFKKLINPKSVNKQVYENFTFE